MKDAPTYRAIEKMGLQDYLGALADFQHELDNHPNNAWAIGERAKLYVKTRNVAAAITDFNRAIKLDPKQGYRSRGSARAACGNQKGAIEDFTQAIRLNSLLTSIKHCRLSQII